MPSLSSLALCFSFILAMAAAASHFVGWACDFYGDCTNAQMLGCAAGVVFVAYVVLDRLETDPPAAAQTQSRKTEPPAPHH
jgi:hypothetical protein